MVSDGGVRSVLDGVPTKVGALSSSLTLPDGSTFRRTEVYQVATNNQMELLGVLTSILLVLKQIKDTGHLAPVRLVSDSQLVIKGICEGGYLDNWRRNGFKTYSKKPVANADIWQVIDGALTKLKELVHVETFWIRGHLSKTEIDSMTDSFLQVCARLNIKCDTALGEALEAVRDSQSTEGCLTVEEKLRLTENFLQTY